MSELSPEKEAKILKQLEFYFGDSNYPTDKFLRAQASLDEHGWISIDVILSFTRMKQFGATAKDVVEILKKHTSSVELKDDEKMLKRVAPMPADQKKLFEKCIYTKGWGEDTTIEDVEEALKEHGKVVCVRFHKNENKKKTDAAFVEFETIESANAAAAVRSFKYKDTEITSILRLTWWLTEKEQRKLSRKKGGGENDGIKIEIKKEIKEEGGEGSKEEEMGEAGELGKKRKADDQLDTPHKKIKVETEKKPFEKGLIIEFKGVAGTVLRQDIKTYFSGYGRVVFVEHKEPEDHGYVRMQSVDEVNKAVAEIPAAQILLGTSVPTVSILTGEDEVNYWGRVKTAKQGKRNMMKGGKKKNFKKRF